MQKLRGGLGSLIVLAAVAACGSDLTPASEDLSGSWSGSATSQAEPTITLALILTLNEAEDGSISGDGRFTIQLPDGVMVRFDASIVSGHHTGDRFSLTLDDGLTREGNTTYSGTVEVPEGTGSTGPNSHVRLNGQLDGGGFNGFQIILRSRP